MATFDEFYASLDPDIGIRGKQFEKFIKWFLKTDPTWASQVDEVWLWNEYPKRWGADCGIDLIFTHKNGNIWAVQSKCVSPKNDIKKSEIDSFLSESNDSKIDGRLLIASTDGIGKNAQQVINRQEKQVVCFLLEQFKQSEIEFPSSMKDLNQGKRKEKKTPKLHQIEAIEKVSKGLQTSDRGQVLMACGTGKTLTSLWIKEKLGAKQVLVLVPSLSLLSQSLKVWNSEANDAFKWICVCSDRTVSNAKFSDDWISNTSEIGIPVTRDPLEIKNFLDEDGSKIIFSTYHSSPLIVEAQEHHDTCEFDLVIADEAHHCAGKVSDSFGCVLDENKIKANKRLFFTATERILSQDVKTKSLNSDFEIASMDDPYLFGEVLYQLKFSTAIQAKLLSDYRVLIVGVNDEMIKQQIFRRNILITEQMHLTDAETYASIVALSKAIQDYGLKKLITFHGRINSAKHFSETISKSQPKITDDLKKIVKISCDFISGGMRVFERNLKLNELKNEEIGTTKILSNARCLSEGIDLPILDGIAFIDPKQSQIDIIQAVGRAIRKSTEESLSYIVLPIYLSDIEKIDDEIKKRGYEKIWKVLLALKSQDDSLMEIIDKLRISLGEKNITKVSGDDLPKIIIDFPDRIEQKFVDSIRNYLVRGASENWLESYGELKKFYLINGHSNFPRDGSTLANWVSNQRTNFKLGKLSERRQRLLKKINFIWDTKEHNWRETFKDLQSYYKENETTRNLLTKDSFLHGWMGDQKQLFQKGRLEKYKIELLETIPDWRWENLYEMEWNDSYEELKEFFPKNNFVIPSSKNNKLGNWANHQINNYKNGLLPQDRIDRLNLIEGWKWRTLKDEDWHNNFEDLENYVREHGVFPSQHKNFLGRWANTQRKSKRKNTLEINRVKKLESLDGWEWEPLKDSWTKSYEKLLDFMNKNNRIPLQKRDPLGSWVTSQRTAYRNKKLSINKIKKLESIKGWKWEIY